MTPKDERMPNTGERPNRKSAMAKQVLHWDHRQIESS